MATTTNYSWSTPDDTALVKDGAAAIRSLGTAIDSTVFTNAGAAINKTIVDAKGDLIIGSADNTVARLAVGGTNGHVLTVNSGATYGAEWAVLPPAGGMSSIASGSLSGSSLVLTSISGSYKNLQLILRDIEISNQAEIRTTVNSVSNYDWMGMDATQTYFNNVNDFGRANFPQTRYNMHTGDDNAALCINIFDYANTTSHKLLDSFISNKNDRSGNPSNLVRCFGVSRDTAAITSVTVGLSTGTFSAGTYILYGVS